MSYDGVGLNPLFYSELSSSYLLYDIFDSHPEIAAALIKEYFGVETEQVLVSRERSYPKKGSIDIFIEFADHNKRCALLIEVKVHDYLSVSDHQINTYYNAVREDELYDDVYFIYLSQFNRKTSFDSIAKPKSLAEALRGKDLIGERFRHLSWEEMHRFLEKHKLTLNRERQLMLELHRSWVVAKNKEDLANNVVETGERTLQDYFGDAAGAIMKLMHLGDAGSEENQPKLRIDAARLGDQELNSLLDGVVLISSSTQVNKKKQYRADELTLEAAEEFLAELAGNREWRLLGFYARLFQFVQEKDYLRFYGTGTRGFSIKVEVKNKGEISLCTLYRNKLIEFSLKR
jgi:hypothetical protein